jgi:hypothetical protein
MPSRKALRLNGFDANFPEELCVSEHRMFRFDELRADFLLSGCTEGGRKTTGISPDLSIISLFYFVISLFNQAVCLLQISENFY